MSAQLSPMSLRFTTHGKSLYAPPQKNYARLPSTGRFSSETEHIKQPFDVPPVYAKPIADASLFRLRPGQTMPPVVPRALQEVAGRWFGLLDFLATPDENVIEAPLDARILP